VDVWEYFQTREREIAECSLRLDEGLYPFAAEEGDQRGRIFCTLSFNGFPETV
jgi:hypothetical protein